MEVRPITSADLAACTEVFYAAEDDLYGRLNLPPLPRNPQALERGFSHILESDAELCWLATSDGRVDAFGMAVARQELRYLSFLFVRPGLQGRGVGRALLAHCLPAGTRRATCVEAIQPVSVGLYAAAGLVPRVPIYTLVGQPRAELPQLPAGFKLVPWPIDDGTVDGLDQQVLGFSRQADHLAWLAWERQRFVLLASAADERVVGYGYAHRSGRLGPVLTRDADHLLPMVGELMRQVVPLDAWQVLVPGPASACFVGLLSAGLRIEGPPAIFCADHTGPDHARYLPATFALP